MAIKGTALSTWRARNPANVRKSTMAYVVVRRFKDDQVDRSPSVDDPARAKENAKRAWMENSDLVEICGQAGFKTCIPYRFLTDP
jgi:hypothetical protein